MKYNLNYFLLSLFNFRNSQNQLLLQLEGIQGEIVEVQKQVECPLPMDSYVKKLQDAKRRVVVVNNVLQNMQVGLLAWDYFVSEPFFICMIVERSILCPDNFRLLFFQIVLKLFLFTCFESNHHQRYDNILA